MKSLVIILALFMTGCTDYERQVSCESFSTPWSDIAGIKEGEIYWEINGSWFSRMSPRNETCEIKRRIIK